MKHHNSEWITLRMHFLYPGFEEVVLSLPALNLPSPSRNRLEVKVFIVFCSLISADSTVNTSLFSKHLIPFPRRAYGWKFREKSCGFLENAVWHWRCDTRSVWKYCTLVSFVSVAHHCYHLNSLLIGQRCRRIHHLVWIPKKQAI